MTLQRILVVVLTAVLATPVTRAIGEESPPVTEATPALPAAVPPPNVFSVERLDQIVSPVALYPDSLLMQILMASTYPLEVIEAERWTKKNPDLKGEELDKALAEKSWDPSVKSLTHFPTVLARMSDNLDWTKDMGDAFLAQQKDVLDAIQPNVAPTPFHGYFFRILTAQGPHAPEGARSYIVNGRMTGGFALVAYPAQYGASGIMTFLVNQLGVVFQKDLGEKTAEIAVAMSAYDPDDSWQPVDE